MEIAGWKLTLPATNVKDGTTATLRPLIAAIPDETEARSKFGKEATLPGAKMEPLTADTLAAFKVRPGEVRKA
jgi:hypothetical protein